MVNNVRDGGEEARLVSTGQIWVHVYISSLLRWRDIGVVNNDGVLTVGRVSGGQFTAQLNKLG